MIETAYFPVYFSFLATFIMFCCKANVIINIIASMEALFIRSDHRVIYVRMLPL